MYTVAGDQPSAYEATAPDSSPFYSLGYSGSAYDGSVGGEGSAYAEMGPNSGGMYAVATNRRVNPLFAEGDDGQAYQVPYQTIHEGGGTGHYSEPRSMLGPDGGYVTVAAVPGAATATGGSMDGGYVRVTPGHTLQPESPYESSTDFGFYAVPLQADRGNA